MVYVRTDVSKELVASIIRETKIRDLITSAVTQLLVTVEASLAC
jgi:hypothetical protein